MAKRRTSRPSAPTQTRAERGEATRSVHFDRVEEDEAGAERAVLIVDDGRAVVVPRDMLPPDAAPGSTLTWTLAVDAAATQEHARATAEVRAELRKTDPGGTIHL